MCGMKNLAAYDREAYATILHKYTRLSHISIAPRELKMCVCVLCCSFLLYFLIFLIFSSFGFVIIFMPPGSANICDNDSICAYSLAHRETPQLQPFFLLVILQII